MMCDPTMAGIKNPIKKIAKLNERIYCLLCEIETREDQIAVMRHEIEVLS